MVSFNFRFIGSGAGSHCFTLAALVPCSDLLYSTFLLVLVKSISTVEGDAFERLLENYRLELCLDVV
ncbi:unnamed protein product [Thelazia callipaeda]|uniref:Secreted protein n=1 Tax=Thelazia callipaeda TaxID=103827 RepID=A0A0N5D552_THECL|nr:unnamed protein product [Thelazia callipaeda]